MEYLILDAPQALRLGQFILPHVRELKDASQFVYVCALAPDGVAGMAVIDPLEEIAELLSVAVSPASRRRGVASGMLGEACRALAEQDIRFLSMTYAMPEEAWGSFEAFLEAGAFSRLGGDDGFYSCTLGELCASRLLSAGGRQLQGGVLSLGDLPDARLRAFSAGVVEQGLFEPIRKADYHPELSLFYLEEGEVAACFLVKELGKTSLENSWTHASPRLKSKAALLELFAQAAAKAGSAYPAHTAVGFACLNEASDRLLHKIIPEPRLLSVQRTYIRSTGSPAEPLLETEEDRSFLRALEEMKGSAPPEYDKEPSVCFQLADDGDLVCSGCVYRTERLTRCARYLSKPGSVLYGGPCPQFAGNA